LRDTTTSWGWGEAVTVGTPVPYRTHTPDKKRDDQKGPKINFDMLISDTC